MNQVKIGMYISEKRREKNLTQEQLAEKLGVSNKTISKWENGKCMPDYSVVKILCEELNITVAELMDGEDKKQLELNSHIEVLILDLIRRTSELESQKNTLMGMVVIALGFAIMSASFAIGGSVFKTFISGFLLGLSAGDIFIGLRIIAKSVSKK